MVEVELDDGGYWNWGSIGGEPGATSRKPLSRFVEDRIRTTSN